MLEKIIKAIRKKISPLDFEKPLVSVIITTYQRPELLTERAIPSVLKQTYQNFEIIVVGDCCEDDTEQRVKALNDKRIKFYNLEKHSEFPKAPRRKWMSLGAAPANYALELIKGQWVAHLDDDDELVDNHLQILLSEAIKRKLDFIYGIVLAECATGKWKKIGEFPLRHGRICNNSVLYRSKFRLIKYNTKSYKLNEPSDWNRWKRIAESGAKIGFTKKVVARYYRRYKGKVRLR